MKNNNELDYFIPGEEGAEDIKHVQERADGSSDGLPEAMDIDLGNGYKECSNWNLDITQKGKLKDLFKTTEPTAEQLVEIFNKTKEKLFPGRSDLTDRERNEVYNEANKRGKNK